MKIIEAIRGTKGVEIFNARRLMKYVLNVKDNELLAIQNEEISEKKLNKYLYYISELKNGKPLQYITHSQYFMGEDFYVNENVLIPQPDTEVVVEEALKIISKSNKSKLKVLDLCTGSGAIAISIKSIFKDKVLVYATDISSKAIKVAKNNAMKILKDENVITFIESNMFENINEIFDIIITNPPYIKTAIIKTLSKEVQNEPVLALDGGEDGLDYYRIIKQNISNYLNFDGFLIMEIGYNQKESLLKMFDNAKCTKDYCGNDRVIVWKNS